MIGRPYQADANRHMTYIGLSNDWIFDEKGMQFCSIKTKNGFTSTNCDHSGVLHYYLKILQEKVPQLRFKIAEEMR
jgi:hypothetical protein